MLIYVEVVTLNQRRQQIFTHGSVYIGRGADSCLRLQGWRVGSNHARLYVEEGLLFIEDLGSLQGTVVNNERIKYYGPIQPQDQILIGPYRLYIRMEKETQSTHDTQSSLKSQSSPDKRSQSIKQSTYDKQLQIKKTLFAHKQLIQGDFNGSTKSEKISVHKPNPCPVTIEQENKPSTELDLSKPCTYSLLHEQYSQHQSAINQLREHVLKEMNLREMVAINLSQENIKKRVAQVTKQAIESKDYEYPVDLPKPTLLDFVLADICGLGPLEPLLADSEISEIMVNGLEGIFIERRGVCKQIPVSFGSVTQLRNVIERIVAPIGRRIDESMPLVDARLADGSRVHIVLPPIALNGPIITIRKFRTQLHGWQQLITNETLTERWAEFLQQCVENKKNMIISGGTGSGKTTLLNVLALSIPAEERIITIEDAAELQLQHQNLVRLEARPANAEGMGDIPIRELVRNALRMRPDRIIVGECRGPEAFDMLSAMNTGHEGSLTTLHANSPREAIHRLESLVLMASMGLPFKAIRDYITMSIDYIVQIERLANGRRRLSEISAITGSEGDVIQMEPVFILDSP